MPLTENEKLIWAASYAVEWSRGLEARAERGVPMYVPTYIENAAAAVVEAREAHDSVKEGWGEEDEVYLMLKQMMQ